MYSSVYKLAKPPQSPSHTYPEAICKGVYSDSYSKSWVWIISFEFEEKQNVLL